MATVAATLGAIALGVAGAVEGAEPKPRMEAYGQCSANAKVRKSTEALPFNVRLRLRCGLDVNRIAVVADKKLTRVQRTPTLTPATAGSFACKREKPKKAACAGTSGPHDTRITIMLRVKPGPCKKPRLKLDIEARGRFYCPKDPPGTPCTDDPRGDDLTTTVAGC